MIQRRTVSLLALTLGLTFSAASALAQTAQSPAPMTGMQGTKPGMAPHADAAGNAPQDKVNPSTAAFQAADRTMMQEMAAPYTGDTDKDFVAHMMPHHEGAVAMARIELQYGKDPALKRMAREIVRSQDREITFMKQWQARHGVR
ncbi:DUF305 domain-containing protein [Robbsia sp. Bb-Pol-6]|uniref:DUF305 domain-containing protein n=1 Tax=Robbsia betulipollinis TaxID=2981849 RepID=A0ABT3ZH03_9BURK|nr:DUF305 domain-containing protein [Robbsia betulipollinis]MCY0385808.1 DUF305 domain-containing protein [Robbsia betulipollinis]